MSPDCQTALLLVSAVGSNPQIVDESQWKAAASVQKNEQLGLIGVGGPNALLRGSYESVTRDECSSLVALFV